MQTITPYKHTHLPSNIKKNKSEFNLIWLDMEMTGLKPNQDKIIEIAVVITDGDLNILAESPVYAIHQPDSVLDAMDKWNQSTHGKSGLIQRVKDSTFTEEYVSQELLNFFKKYTYAHKSPMCGNSICQDRRFMFQYMPSLEAYFHYRNVDVSTIKELAKRWKPDILKGFVKKQLHTALADIYESIEELKYYRTHFMLVDANNSNDKDSNTKNDNLPASEIV
jgi:oligoribonuclease